MATSKLSTYNQAAVILGTRTLTTLTDNVEPRRVFDALWDDVRDFCLQQGHWKFAQRTVKLDFNASITPAFGLTRAFTKPTDFVRTSNFCYDEFLVIPIIEYTEEQGHWYTEVDEVYVKYVSNDEEYGFDYTLWPATFSYFVAAYLAVRSSNRIVPAQGVEQVIREYEDAKDNALFKDAIEGPTQYLPTGRWAQSRFRGTHTSRRLERSPQGPLG